MKIKKVVFYLSRWVARKISRDEPIRDAILRFIANKLSSRLIYFVLIRVWAKITIYGVDDETATLSWTISEWKKLNKI